MPWIQHEEKRLNLDKVIQYEPFKSEGSKGNFIKFKVQVPINSPDNSGRIATITWVFKNADEVEAMVNGIDELLSTN